MAPDVPAVHPGIPGRVMKKAGMNTAHTRLLLLRD